VQQEPLTTTGPEVQSLAVANYHKAMIGLARDSLDSVSHKQRNVSSLTMAISAETYAAVVQELQSVQQRIIDLATREQRPGHVYQLNFQMFPVTALTEEGGP
jgi:uncharacterized protein (TIGR02147 family)